MSDRRNGILDELVRRVAARTGLDLAGAEWAVEDARAQRGEHLEVVGEEYRALFEERVRPALDAYRPVLRRMAHSLHAVHTSRAPVAEALEVTARVEAREGIRDHERGLRFARRHPDMAELDLLLDRLYERPG
ncbi:hypothetical protein [Streptomyces daliensis]|uniref:Uncharacterized protein n=1 Tax=Streptomyces daliensis TaxID=299421 RepID=A0A8T4IUT4_9ACTN|nr:hypothetical protein [Streptomyces daliensis]